MCGIAGILRFDGSPPDEAVLRRLGGRIAHRGPDDEGYLVDGPLGLAHRRLSILDLSAAARQPMGTGDGGGVICYNGEVYNFRELRAELEREGATFHSTGDTEVLLQACRRWGVVEAARRANGMFAFAYWDGQHRELWLARDRTGIKPLYYHRNAARLVFASEIRALLEDAPARPDTAAVLGLLAGVPLHDPHTPFQDIHAVEAGQVLRIDERGAVEARRFYSLAQAVDPDLYRELDGMPEQEVVATFDRLMQRSVELHLASDAKVGVMASGGLDSSLVAHLTRRHLPEIAAYHADVSGPLSERTWAERQAAYTRMPLHVATMAASELPGMLAEVTHANECPLALHPNTVPFLLVCRLAAREGVKVLLTGEGADELFGGYPSFAANTRRRRGEVWLDRLARAMGLVGLGRIGRALVRYATSDEHGGIRSKNAGLLSLGRAARIAQDGAAAYDFIPDRLERESQIDLFSYLHGYLQSILWRNDRMGMAASLESRVPFLENELIRHAMSLPMRYKIRGDVNKWVMRAVADRHLPRELSRRPKFGFPVETDVVSGLRPEAFSGGFLSEYFSVGGPELEALWRIEPKAKFRWLLVEIWGQLFFQGRTCDAVSRSLLDAATSSPKPAASSGEPLQPQTQGTNTASAVAC